MKKVRLVLGVILSVFLISLVSAGVSYSGIKNGYNLEDTINVNLNVEPLEQGPIRTDLICGGNGKIVFYNTNASGEMELNVPLTTAHIQNLSGDCRFFTTYGGEDYGSKKFQISDELIVKLDIDSLVAKPDEEIIISGVAKRISGENAEGEVEISIPSLMPDSDGESEDSEEINETGNETGNETETNSNSDGNETESGSGKSETIEKVYEEGVYYGEVSDGSFEVAFSLDDEIPADNYRVDVRVYEKKDGEIISEGVVRADLEVKSVLEDVEVALSDQNFDPGETISFKPSLLDQSGKEMEGEVSVIIKDEYSNRVYEKIVASGETVDYKISGNMSAGYYELEVSSKDVYAEKKFYINEKALVEFNIENQTLVVTNVGNVPYNQDIQVELNGKPFVKEVELDKGESRKFRLTGSNQEYNVEVSDGENSFSRSGVVLTGHAIDVDEVKEAGSLAFSTPLIWIFFIIVLGAGALFLFRNVLKKKSFAYPFKGRIKKHFHHASENVVPQKTKDLRNKGNENVEKKQNEVKQENNGARTENNKKGAGQPLVPPNKAEKVLVLNGKKYNSAILVINIKNKLSKSAKEGLEKAVKPVYDKKGAIYEKGDNVYAIFSPVMTRTMKNKVIAAKVAEDIKSRLNEHNKKFKDKIEFGFGINSGEVINKIEDKKLKFTSLGNFVNDAKKLAEVADKEILISKKVYDSSPDIKADTRQTRGGKLYVVRGVVDHERNQNFIKGFLDRQKREK